MHKSFIYALSFAACASLLLASAPASADCNNPFGKPNEVLEFHLKISKADWQALLADKIGNVDNFGGGPPMVDSPPCRDKFKEFKAEFKCGNETTWLKIGVRKKKGTERDPMGEEAPGKPPLKLDFNEDFMGMQPTAMGQRWPAALGENGFRRLTLNNGQGNRAGPADMQPPFMLPVLLTEHVALRLLNKEVPSSPRAAFAKLTVYHEDSPPAGEYKGVYLLAEDIDRTAIEQRFGKGVKGRLIKASTPDCSPELVYEDMMANTYETNASIRAFEQWVAKDPNQCGMKWLDETKKGLDLDVLLRQEAIREILVNGNDTLTNSRAYLEWERYGDGNNWYAFDPANGLRQYIPWDVDLTFGNQRGACRTPTPSTMGMMAAMDGGIDANRWKCPYDMPLLEWCNAMPKIMSTPQTKSRLGRGITCHPETQKRYLQVMCQLTNGPMSAAEIVKVWDDAFNAVKVAVPLEKHQWMGKDPLDEAAVKSIGAEYKRLRDWIPKRIASVQEQITKLGVPCTPGCPANAVEACSYNGGAGQRRCVTNAWTACSPAAGSQQPPPPRDGGAPDARVDAGRSDGGVADASAEAGMMSGESCGGDAGVALKGDAPPPPPPPAMDAAADMSVSGSGGASGSGSGGSSGGGTRRGGSSGSNLPPGDEKPAQESGCGCRVGAESTGSAPTALVLLGFAAIALRLRRRK